MINDTAHYVVGNGLGNIIQTTPAYNYLRSRFQRVIVTCHPKWAEFTRSVYKDHTVLVGGGASRGANVFRNVHPYDFIHGGRVSEVEKNLHLVGCSTPGVDNKVGFCGYSDYDGEGFEILLCDGYNKRTNGDDWLVKSYSKWEELVEWLSMDGCMDVASIGLPEEYIHGTVDKTGIGLLETFDLIRRTKLLITNDTGFYHAACAFGTPCLVLFTMTDTDKNYDPLFHKSAIVMSAGLPCQPCQLKGSKYWLTNKINCRWKCRDIPVYHVIKEIRSALNG